MEEANTSDVEQFDVDGASTEDLYKMRDEILGQLKSRKMKVKGTGPRAARKPRATADESYTGLKEI